MAFRPWFPLAFAASTVGGFLLWWSFSDYERARYYPVILSVPVVIFAGLGLFGISGDLPIEKTQGQIIQPLPFF